MKELTAVVDQANMTVLVGSHNHRVILNLLDPDDVECWSKCLPRCRVLLKDYYKAEYFYTLFEMGLITPKNFESAMGFEPAPRITIKEFAESVLGC